MPGSRLVPGHFHKHFDLERKVMSLSKKLFTLCMLTLAIPSNATLLAQTSTVPSSELQQASDSSPVKQLSSVNFKSEVEDSDIPVIVDFYASWCGPCKMLKPNLETIAREFKGKVKVVKIDIDQCPDLAQRFNITQVPSLLIFKDGKVKERKIGFQSVDKLRGTCNDLSK